MRDEKEIYRDAVKQWGKRSQVVVAIEELSELTHALTKDLRQRDHNIIEEIVDVEIMLEQLKIIYGTDGIAQIKKSKLERMEKLLIETR